MGPGVQGEGPAFLLHLFRLVVGGVETQGPCDGNAGGVVTLDFQQHTGQFQDLVGVVGQELRCRRRSPWCLGRG